MRRGPRSRVRAHEDVLGAGGHEAVDQVLRQRAVYLAGAADPLQAVEARIADVDVQAVLVGGVPEAAEAGTEVAAVRPAEVGDCRRGSSGCAVRKSEITVSRVRTSRSVP